jgi:Family of unknown function (DUF5706)
MKEVELVVLLQPEPKQPAARSTIEMMYSTTLAGHLKLSDMADHKAGLMISINSIIISVMTTFLVHEFASNPKLLVPIGILLIVSLLTITFALLSTKPGIKPKQKDGTYENLDLLFFGDYIHLSMDDYTKAMISLMDDEQGIKNNLIANIYAQGKVIDNKFRLLNLAYSTFMYGFPLAIIAFLVMLAMSK